MAAAQKHLALIPVELTAGGIVRKVEVAGIERRVEMAIEGWEVEFLDKSGDTLPRHFYEDVLPALAVFIAPRSGQPAGSAAGDDVAGDGTIEKPYASITKAFSATTSTRNTIVARGGTIGGPGHGADAMLSSNGGIFNARSFTLQAYRDEDPWFNGGHEVDKLGIFACSGAQMTQIVQGIGIRGMIGNSNAGNAGAIYFSSGTNGNATQIFRDFVVRDIDGTGVNWFKPRGDRGARCERGVIRDTNSTALTGTHNFGSNFQPGVEPSWAFRNDMRFQHLYITRANLGDHRDGQPGDTGGYAGSFQAAAKIHGFLGSTFYGSLIEDINPDASAGGYGCGIWYDVGNREANIVSTHVRRCARSAFFWEVGSTGYGINLIAEDCGRAKNHSNFRVASEKIQLWNCLSKGGASLGEWYDDIRSLASDGYGWDTRGEQLHNCLFVGPTSGASAENFLVRLYDNGQKTAADGPNFVAGTGTNPPDYFAAAGGGSWSTNAWWLGGTPNILRFDQTPPGNQTYQTPAQIRAGDATHAAHPELALNDRLETAYPLNADLSVKSTALAFANGEPLPAAVAALCGQVAGWQGPLGAFDCPSFG